MTALLHEVGSQGAAASAASHVDAPTGIEVRALTMGEVQRVTHNLNPGRNAETHRGRLRLQDQGRCAYMIAWRDSIPVAHGMVLWGGPVGSPRQHLPTQCPYIEDLWVAPDMRSQGVGSLLVGELESMAAERGHDLIGLSVGIENVRGIALYTRLGYRALKIRNFTLSGTVVNVDGDISFWSEDCQYMRKPLATNAGSRDLR